MYLRPGMAVVPMRNGVQLRGGDEEILVIDTDSPAAVERMLRRLAEGANRQALHDEFGDGNAELLDAVIDQLNHAGMLTDQPLEDDDEIGRYLSHFANSSPQEIVRPTGPVGVCGQGECVASMAEALGRHGIKAVERAAERDVAAGIEAVACIWERPDLKRVLAVNDAVCRGCVPCLFVDLSHGRHATVGPFYLPGEGSCYRCFRRRLRENTAALEEFDAAETAILDGPDQMPSYGILPAFRDQTIGVACGELFALLSRHRPLRTLNRATTLDFEGLRMWTEPAWRVPWCEACGTKHDD